MSLCEGLMDPRKLLHSDFCFLYLDRIFLEPPIFIIEEKYLVKSSMCSFGHHECMQREAMILGLYLQNKSFNIPQWDIHTKP